MIFACPHQIGEFGFLVTDGQLFIPGELFSATEVNKYIMRYLKGLPKDRQNRLESRAQSTSYE